MALFPRFGSELPAKAAKPAKVGPTSAGHNANFRNFRAFRNPVGLEFQQQAQSDDHLAQRIADLKHAYAERVAIVMEAGDIGEFEACRISEAEIGRRFVEEFITVDEQEFWQAHNK